MSHPRGLTPEEAALWDKLSETVKPLHPRIPPRNGEGDQPKAGGGAPSVVQTGGKNAAAAPTQKPAKLPLPRSAGVPLHPRATRGGPPPRPGEEPGGLDSHWERRFKGGVIAPDFTLDLHGHTLDSAHARLDDGLIQAKAMGARVVLVIAGKPRPVEAADRGERRGAIRAKLLDWLAAGPHGSDIAAIRKAHRRHGGEGALYLVLKRKR